MGICSEQKGKKKSKKEVGDTSSEASSSVARPPVTNGHLPVNGTQQMVSKRSGTEGANRFQYIERQQIHLSRTLNGRLERPARVIDVVDYARE